MSGADVLVLSRAHYGGFAIGTASPAGGLEYWGLEYDP